MALIFFDGFESFDPANPALDKWTNIAAFSSFTWDATAGSNGTAGLLPDDASDKVIAGLPTPVDRAWAGVRFKMPIGPTAVGAPLAFFNGASAQVTVTVETDGSMNVRRGSQTGTIIGSSAGLTLVEDDFVYIEAMAIIANSPGGSVEVRVNGATVINATMQDTLASGPGTIDNVGAGGMQRTAGTPAVLDDFYLIDEFGPAPFNTFLGVVQVDTLRPTADGALSNLGITFPAGPDQFAQIDDDSVKDEDTTYLESTAHGQISTFVFSALPVIGGGATIFAIQTNTRVTKLQPGPASINVIARNGAVNRTLGTLGVSSGSYISFVTLELVDPATSGAWTDLTLTEFGMEVV